MPARYPTVEAANDWLIALDDGSEFVIVNCPDREDARAGALQVIDDCFPGAKIVDMQVYSVPCKHILFP